MFPADTGFERAGPAGEQGEKMTSRFASVSVLMIGFAVGCASLPHQQGPSSVSGVWKTRAPAPYIVEHTVHRPQGKAIELDDIELLERKASIEWRLEERPDGLVTGTNQWISYDSNDEEIARALEPLLGVRDGARLVLEEPADETIHTPQLVFHCTFEGPDQIRVIGYEVGSKDLMAMRLVLHRQ